MSSDGTSDLVVDDAPQAHAKTAMTIRQARRANLIIATAPSALVERCPAPPIRRV